MTARRSTDDKRFAAYLRRHRASFLSIGLLAALATVLISLHVVNYPQLSPFDEGVHFDYVDKVSRGDLVHKGDRLDPAAMDEIACRGIDVHGLKVPRCGTHYAFGAFPAEGYNYADIHPPGYYVVTAALARLIRASGAADNLFTAARLSGALWLGAALVLLWLAGLELGIERAQLAISLLLLVMIPWVVHASATVNNDASALPAGALIVLAGLVWERKKTRPWFLWTAAFAVCVLKTTSVFAVGAVALYLLIRGAFHRGTGPWRRYAIAAVGTVGAAAIPIVAWSFLRATTGTGAGGPLDGLFRVDALGLDSVLSNVPAFLEVTTELPAASILDSPALEGLAFVSGLLFVVATLSPAMSGRISSSVGALAAGTSIILLTGGALLMLANFYLLGVRFDIQSRYGLSLAGPMALALAASLRWRVAIWTAAGIAAAVGTILVLTLTR